MGEVGKHYRSGIKLLSCDKEHGREVLNHSECWPVAKNNFVKSFEVWMSISTHHLSSDPTECFPSLLLHIISPSDLAHLTIAVLLLKKALLSKVRSPNERWKWCVKLPAASENIFGLNVASSKILTLQRKNTISWKFFSFSIREIEFLAIVSAQWIPDQSKEGIKPMLGSVWLVTACIEMIVLDSR